MECGDASDCPVERPACFAGRCTQCAANTDCVEGACANGTCTPLCEDDAICTARQGRSVQTHCVARRCDPVSCTADAQCAVPFSCTSGVCAQQACTDDAACRNAPYCVSGKCSEGLGHCVQLLGSP